MRRMWFKFPSKELVRKRDNLERRGVRAGVNSSNLAVSQRGFPLTESSFSILELIPHHHQRMILVVDKSQTPSYQPLCELRHCHQKVPLGMSRSSSAETQGSEG